MKKLLVILCAIFITNVVKAEFSGELVLEPKGCEKTRKCYTKYALHYIDPDELGWEARAGLETDGATIPVWAESVIGDPYDSSYLKAAVVHDHYCKRHVRKWRETHRAFYHMLIELGVPKVKSKVMYYAVFIGGPKWIEIIEPSNCGLQCINSFAVLPPSEKLIYEDETYSNIGNLKELLFDLEKELTKKSLTLDELDELAESKFPDSYFYDKTGIMVYKPRFGVDR